MPFSGFSPYFLVFGRRPIIPPARRERLSAAINLDDPVACLKDLKERAAILQKECLVAADNLMAAQHKDIRRYEHTRSGHHVPAVREFSKGDLVYLHFPAQHTLQMGIRPTIL